MIPMFQRAMDASKSKLWPSAVICLAIVLLASPEADGQAQPPESEAVRDLSRETMLQNFHQGREAFRNSEWIAASDAFRHVSAECPGSPLALESNYFAMLADWKRGATDWHEPLLQWLREAKSLQDRVRLSKRSAPDTWDSWIANTHLLLSQYERQHREGERAQQRLEGLLQISGTERASDVAWPAKLPTQTEVAASVWYELGLVAQECHQDWAKSLEYLKKAIEVSHEGSEVQCLAIVGLVKAHIQSSESQSAIDAIERLESIAPNLTWRSRAALLRSEAARANHDAVGFTEALRPAIEWSLAGQTDLASAYDVAIALLEARDDEQAHAILRHVIDRDPNHPKAIEARIRLARDAMQRSDWQDAKRYLDQAVGLRCPPSWVPHAHLARGQVLLELGLPEAAHDDLVIAFQHAGDDADLETAIRFELGEALMQRQRWDEANAHWEVLVGRFAGDSQFSTQFPLWVPRVWLHQAEMQALRQNWSEVETIVSRIQSQFPECDCRDDVDYIKARCFISKALFDDARQILDRIAREPTHPSPDLAARARWMMGETFLMQRRYAEAVRAYEGVLETGSSLYWQSAARMQIGQCYEVLRDGSAARNAYQSLLDKDADGAFSTLARQKLASMEPAVASKIEGVRTSNETPVAKQR